MTGRGNNSALIITYLDQSCLSVVAVSRLSETRYKVPIASLRPHSGWAFLLNILELPPVLILCTPQSKQPFSPLGRGFSKCCTQGKHCFGPQLMIPWSVTGTAQPHVGSLTQREIHPPGLAGIQGFHLTPAGTAGKKANTSIVGRRSKWILKSSVPRQPLRLQA